MTQKAITIDSVDFQGRGIGRLTDGKVVFIENAITAEIIEIHNREDKKNYATADVYKIIKKNPYRTSPPCQYFSKCGGCSFQHIESNTQTIMKQRMLEDLLFHKSKIKIGTILPPISGPDQNYRHRARLSVRYIETIDKVIIGFYEKNSKYITDISTCIVLAHPIPALLPAISDLFKSLSVRSAIPQLEISVGEKSTALVIRHLIALSQNDEKKLLNFQKKHSGIQWWLQAAGPESAHPLHNNHPLIPLTYSLPEFNLEFSFHPTDFIQNNLMVNRMLVRLAYRYLNPQPHERIADLFCGLGNFSLALARSGAHIIGIEGSLHLVTRANQNSHKYEMSQRVKFYHGDLFTEEGYELLSKYAPFDKVLIDPPRDGAITVCKALGKLRPKVILYISCNPATLARDLQFLTHQAGYKLVMLRVINMFPHTAHTESMILLSLPGQYDLFL